MAGTITANGAHIETKFAPPATKAEVEAIGAAQTKAGATNVTVTADPAVAGGWILAADWVLPAS